MLFLNLFKTKPKLSNMKFLLKNNIRNLKDLTLEVPVPEVSKSTIKKHIKQTCPSFREQYTCFVINCNLCGIEKNAKIYINKTTGHFMCSVCKKSGQWDKLQPALSSEKDSKKWKTVSTFRDFSALEDINQSVLSIKASTILLNSLTILEIREVLKKFNLPAVAVSTFDNLDVRIDEEKSSLYFPLEDVEAMVVGYRKIDHSSDEETVVPSIACGGLLTKQMPRSKDTAVLVPNISDFLILCNAKINVNIVCLPNNIKSLPQYYLPSLERFKKLVLWMGCDTPSWEAARHFAKKLGEKRCYLVRTCDTQNLPHVDDTQDFKGIISKSQPVYHKSITTFANLRPDVLSALQNNEIVQGIKWKRYPSLNKILKGHRRGELTVITGPTGSGKTTFISDYSLDLAMQGVNTLWGSFEISNSRLAKTMLQQMAGLPLQDNLHLFDQFADRFEKLPIYFMTFHGQQSIKVVMEAVQHATYIYDIAHVIVDNLQFMMGIDENQRFVDRFLKQDSIVAAFRNFATRSNCHVTLVIHPRKERDDDLTASSIFGGAKASQEADNILIIQDKRLISARGKKFLQIVKNRYSGDLGVFPLDFDKASLSFQQKKVQEKKSQESGKTDDVQSKTV